MEENVILQGGDLEMNERDELIELREKEQRRKLEGVACEGLKKRGISQDFAQILIGKSHEETEKNVADFAQSFEKSLRAVKTEYTPQPQVMAENKGQRRGVRVIKR